MEKLKRRTVVAKELGIALRTLDKWCNEPSKGLRKIDFEGNIYIDVSGCPLYSGEFDEVGIKEVTDETVIDRSAVNVGQQV